VIYKDWRSSLRKRLNVNVINTVIVNATINTSQKILLFEFIQLMAKEEQLVDFLIQHGVLPSVINCEKCNNEINIDKKTLLFRCRKRFLTTKGSVIIIKVPK